MYTFHGGSKESRYGLIYFGGDFSTWKKSQGADIYKNHQIKTVKIKKSNNKNNRSFLDFLFSTWVLVGFWLEPQQLLKSIVISFESYYWNIRNGILSCFCRQ